MSLWFADGTNYPGQDDITARQQRLAEALGEVYAALPEGIGMLLEYKLFEPGFYTMDVPDWGTSLVHCLALGDKANVLVDTGHHAPGTNIEFIVASLLRLGRLGGFHFNSRFYADDDLLVGAADPYQLFRIMNEIVAAGAHLPGSGVAFMLDQCHNVEEKVPAELRSVMNVQEATAKALLVDREALRSAQAEGDVMAANAVLVDAFSSDVRPLLAELRQEMGLGPDPLAAYARSGHAERVRGGAGRRCRPRLGGLAMTTPDAAAPDAVTELLDRSHRLGKDPRNTNYAGGNTSTKARATDPLTGRAGRAHLGKGLGRRPRHVDRQGPRCSSLGPFA